MEPEVICENHYDQIRKATKISIIINEIGIPIGIHMDQNNVHYVKLSF